MKHFILAASVLAFSTPALAFRGPEPLKHFHKTKCQDYNSTLLLNRRKPENRETLFLLRKFDTLNFNLKTALQSGSVELKEWRAKCRPLVSESEKDSKGSVARQNTTLNQSVATQSGELQAAGKKITDATKAIMDAYNKPDQLYFRKFRELSKDDPNGKLCANAIDGNSTLFPQYADKFDDYAKIACKQLSPAPEGQFNEYVETIQFKAWEAANKAK